MPVRTAEAGNMAQDTFSQTTLKVMVSLWTKPIEAAAFLGLEIESFHKTTTLAQQQHRLFFRP